MAEYRNKIWTYDLARSIVSRDFDPDGDLRLMMTFPQDKEVLEQEVSDQDDEKAVELDKNAEEATTEQGLSPSVATPTPTPTTTTERISGRASGTIDMLVSSRHMTLASSVFKVMLGPSFKEGLTLRSEKKLTLNLPDDDPVVFSVLLNIIHGHANKVPRNLDLNLLTKVSFLVDKYQLQEVVSVFSVSWTFCMDKNYTPLAVDQELILRLWLYWIFSRKRQFNGVMLKALQKSTRRIHPQEYSIPDVILDYIEKLRFQGIDYAIQQLRSLLERNRCKRNDDLSELCDQLVRTSFERSLRETGLWPLPSRPYVGISREALGVKIDALKVALLEAHVINAGSTGCDKVQTDLQTIRVNFAGYLGRFDKNKFMV